MRVVACVSMNESLGPIPMQELLVTLTFGPKSWQKMHLSATAGGIADRRRFCQLLVPKRGHLRTLSVNTQGPLVAILVEYGANTGATCDQKGQHGAIGGPEELTENASVSYRGRDS